MEITRNEYYERLGETKLPTPERLAELERVVATIDPRSVRPLTKELLGYVKAMQHRITNDVEVLETDLELQRGLTIKAVHKIEGLEVQNRELKGFSGRTLCAYCDWQTETGEGCLDRIHTHVETECENHPLRKKIKALQAANERFGPDLLEAAKDALEVMAMGNDAKYRADSEAFSRLRDTIEKAEGKPAEESVNAG